MALDLREFSLFGVLGVCPLSLPAALDTNLWAGQPGKDSYLVGGRMRGPLAALGLVASSFLSQAPGSSTGEPRTAGTRCEPTTSWGL